MPFDVCALHTYVVYVSLCCMRVIGNAHGYLSKCQMSVTLLRIHCVIALRVVASFATCAKLGQ